MRFMWVLVAATALMACAKREGDEAKIRKMLDDCVAALEARDAARAIDQVADDYTDSSGRSRKQLKQLMFFALQRGPVLVKLGRVDVTLKGSQATARLTALAVQGSGELKTAADLLPTNARTFELELTLQKAGAAWRIARVDGLPSL